MKITIKSEMGHCLVDNATYGVYQPIKIENNATTTVGEPIVLITSNMPERLYELIKGNIEYFCNNNSIQ